MKNNIKLHTLLIAGLLAVSSCNSDTSNNMENKADTVSENIEQGAENMAANVKDAVNGNADSNFVVKAARANMAELRILQAGWDNGTNKELKGHAKMMIADHKMLGDKVMAFSKSKGYVLPASDEGKADGELEKLSKKTKGVEWDKEWVDQMISEHKDAINMFEDAQDDVKDAELKTIIADALPKLRSHLEMMKAMEDKMKK